MRQILAAMLTLSVVVATPSFGCTGASAVEPVPDVEILGDAADVRQEADAAPDAAGVSRVLPTALAGWIRLVETEDEELHDRSIEVDFRTGPWPTAIVVVAEAGACTMLAGSNDISYLCGDACTWGEAACIAGSCVSYPGKASAGPIEVTGLNGPLTLVPAAGGYTFQGDVPGDLFSAGAEIRAKAVGDATGAFELVARGVPTLAWNPKGFNMEMGKDLVFHWTPAPDAPPGTRIYVNLQTGWHGTSTKAQIWCEGPDNGELVVPASMVDAFPVPSCGMCESSYIARFTRDVVDLGAGPIELVVASRWSFTAWWPDGGHRSTP